MAAALLVLTGGCASLDGQAAPVLTLDAVTQVSNDFTPTTALAQFYDPKKNSSERKLYRDKVIGAYLAAADIRYLEFRRNISREMKGTGVALDVAVLGLTAGASLAGEATANVLSAAAAAFAGTRATLSTELWFKRTLPAIVTAMEARRTEIRTQILVRMQGSAEAYSLSEAFSDIARYQEAASLDTGISLVTAAANQRAVQADARYADVVLTYSGAPPPGAAARFEDLKTKLVEARTVPGKIFAVADELKIDRQALSEEEAYFAILDAMDKIDTPQKLTDFTAKVTKGLGESDAGH